ncbi:hypothetical protein [uncultured Georgenia sp.]|uniref:hypothetical protein n=1 Tax=uncultured Georgenia sp. TaxID=378209 RepID=UPI0026289BA2|nr:hypothetical protein [uncultured Georgenia sp.]
MMSRLLVPPLLAATLAGVPLGTAAVPDDVAAWFADTAAGEVTGVEWPVDVEHVTVGAPRPQHRWSTEFLAGEATDTPVTPLEQWVAPYAGDGVPAGTVVAWREEDAVTLAYVDDHAELGKALTDLAPDAVLVEEPMLGAYFSLVDDEVTTLIPGFYQGPSSAPLSTFRPVLAEQLDELVAAAVPEPAPTARWWVPVVWTGLALALLTALAMAGRALWRRSAPA